MLKTITITKSKLLLNEIIQGIVHGYPNIIKTIADVICNDDEIKKYANEFIRLDIIESDVVTVNICHRLNIDDEWIVSPTLQFDYRIDNNQVGVKYYKGKNEFIKHIKMLKNLNY